MKETYASVYSDFHCIGTSCRHNCCIGWEIDIDRDTLTRYQSVPGELGERIRNAIEQDECAHFQTDECGRCRMLDPDNLCAIQRAAGESLLCGICRDHPRYRVFLPGRTEIGLGLCCEEAARLWISERERITMPFDPGAVSPETAALLISREKLLDIVYDRRLSLGGRMKKLLFVSGGHIPRRSATGWARLLGELEALEDGWQTVIGNQYGSTNEAAYRAYLGNREREYENLLTYFFLRHYLADEGRELPARAAFAVFSVSMLFRIGSVRYAKTGHFDASEQMELVRLWSANVEYSENNMHRLLDELSR